MEEARYGKARYGMARGLSGPEHVAQQKTDSTAGDGRSSDARRPARNRPRRRGLAGWLGGGGRAARDDGQGESNTLQIDARKQDEREEASMRM